MSDVPGGMAEWSHADLVAFVVTLSERVATLESENSDLRAEIAALRSKGSSNGHCMMAAV